jgi:hypothetical protein
MARSPKPVKPPRAPYRDGPFWRPYNDVTTTLERWRPWYRWPKWPAIFLLIGVRNRLRQRNLFDLGYQAAPTVNPVEAPPFKEEYRTQRAPDGSWNTLPPGQQPDQEHGVIGMSRTRFGRNVWFASAWRESTERFMDPSPVDVSDKLLARRGDFKSAEGALNGLAAAWIQFMVRDWMSHGPGDKDDAWEIPRVGQPPLKIPRTIRDPSRPSDPGGFPESHINTQSSWWDATQLYGANRKEQASVREGERSPRLAEEFAPGQRMRPLAEERPPDPIDEPGMWLGLLMLYRLFVKEHNHIAGRLAAEHPRESPEWVFQKTRLILSALIAKIHTLEWTTALLGHPAVKASLEGQWQGLLGGVPKAWRRWLRMEELLGIPGSRSNDFGVPYSLTEEFAAVYRMHSLVPDEWTFLDAASGSVLRDAPRMLGELAGKAGLDAYRRIGLENALYSFGLADAGALVLHNFPDELRKLRLPDDPQGIQRDIAATDIVRCRELGLPRYCEFRRCMDMPAPRSFEELVDPKHPQWAGELSGVYGNVEAVDLLVGLLAELKPRKFGIGDTTFRVFVVMTARRLKADRFFTDDFTEAVYTPLGMEMIKTEDMASVMRRHTGGVLDDKLATLVNPFAPWDGDLNTTSRAARRVRRRARSRARRD